jgi:mycothiol synthase
VRLKVVSTLSADESSGVIEVIAAATEADDRCPVSESTLLHLRNPGLDHRVKHVLAEVDGRIAGYGVLIPTEGPRPRVAEIAVEPSLRGRGIGHAIIEQVIALGGSGGVALWAHGRDAPAGPLAESMGFDRQRTLLQMRRSLVSRLPRAPLPHGFTMRTFRPGIDDAAFLAVNAAAFARLPDQGGWGQADLDARLGEPWFDPAGFFLVESRNGELAGFHWTKMHRPEPLGEIYVLAVAPDFAGRGLATPLAVSGLRHLRERGATTAMLYADESNSAAVRRYQRLGFTVWDVDVLYARES